MTLGLQTGVQRSTAVAVVVSLALHVLVLLGVNFYSANHQRTQPWRAHSDLHPLMQVVLVPQSMLALQTMATPAPALAEAAPAAHSSPVRPAQQKATESPPQPSPPQPSPPTPGGAQPTQTRPTDAVAEGGEAQPVRSSGGPSAPATPAAGLHAAASEHSQSDRLAAAAGARPAEAPALQPAPQAARPDYAYNPPPEYPLLLREQGVGGVVWLRVWVDRDGHPADIRIAQGSGYRLLDDAALRAVKRWRFTPASNAGQRLASWVEFPVRFTLDSDSLV